MRSRLRRRAGAGLLGLLIVAAAAGPSRAQDTAVVAEAARRFDLANQLADDGDNAGALAEFKRVYELIPNKVVLFNLGVVYADLGRPVEAVDTFDRLLREPGALDPRRLERARRLRAEQARRVAELAIESNVPAAIQIDGVDRGTTPLAAPLKVAGGTRVVRLLATGYLPARREVTVAGETRQVVSIALAPSEARAANLVIDTSPIGVEVRLDGLSLGRTPLPASVTVAPGRRVVELSRPGYLPVRRELELGDGGSATLAEELRDAGDLASVEARLVLRASEDHVHVTLDGKPHGVYRASLPAPAGLHRLRIERAGFEPIERTVELARGSETVVRATLRPTPETRLAYVREARARRTWGWTSLLAGAVVAGGSATFLLVNELSLERARGDVRAIDALFQPDQPCDRTGRGNHVQCRADQAAAYEKLNDRELGRTIGVVGAAAGLVGLGAGVYLLATANDPARYDRPATELTLATTGWVSPRGGGLALSGRF